jgi:hypothetical protein
MRTAARIAEALSGGRKVKAHGGNYLVPCPAHQDASPSLSLRDSDRGVMVHCFAGCAPGDVYAAIRRLGRGLLEPGQTAPEPVKGSSEYDRRQHERAAWLWSQRRPIAGTIAEKYLRQARGITCPLPPTLAFLPAHREHPPALIAAIALVTDEPEPGLLGAPRNVASVHLTKLLADGSGKTDNKPDKITIGSPTIKIGDEVHYLPIVIAPPNDLLGLAITEGIEDALSVHQTTGLGAWAAGAAGRMPGLAHFIPSYIESVTIWAHPDPAGQDGARGLAQALLDRGVEVRVEGLLARSLTDRHIMALFRVER